LEDLFLLSSSHTIVFPSRFSLLLPIGPSYLPTQTSEEVRGEAGVRDGEGFCGAVVRETEKPRNLEAMGWALAWYRVERQETRKSKSERREYLPPKSSTTKTKRIERETWLQKQGVEVS
jgi:hypothetical protein